MYMSKVGAEPIISALDILITLYYVNGDLRKLNAEPQEISRALQTLSLPHYIVFEV